MPKAKFSVHKPPMEESSVRGRPCARARGPNVVRKCSAHGGAAWELARALACAAAWGLACAAAWVLASAAACELAGAAAWELAGAAAWELARAAAWELACAAALLGPEDCCVCLGLL